MVKKSLVLVPAPMAETSVANPIPRVLTSGETSKNEELNSKFHAELASVHKSALADNVRKGTIASVPTNSLSFIGEANPRKFIGDLKDLRASLQFEGQKEPLVVGRLDGEALAYVNRCNKTKDAPGSKLYVFQGTRRLTALRALVSEGLARFESATIIDVGTISDRAQFESIVTDDTARKNPDLRYELAMKVGALLDAGWTMDAIARSHGKSMGWVQTLLDVYNLPDTDEFPVRTNIREFDVETAKVAAGTMDADERKAPFLDTATVKTLALSWKIHSTGEVPKKVKAENIPEKFPKLWADIVARGPGRPETPKTSVSYKELSDTLQRIAGTRGIPANVTSVLRTYNLILKGSATDREKLISSLVDPALANAAPPAFPPLSDPAKVTPTAGTTGTETMPKGGKSGKK